MILILIKKILNEISTLISTHRFATTAQPLSKLNTVPVVSHAVLPATELRSLNKCIQLDKRDEQMKSVIKTLEKAAVSKETPEKAKESVKSFGGFAFGLPNSAPNSAKTGFTIPAPFRFGTGSTGTPLSEFKFNNKVASSTPPAPLFSLGIKNDD